MAMKTNNRTMLAMAILLLASIPGMAFAQPRVSIQLEFGGPPARGFYGSLAESYDVPERDIWVMHEAGVADNDIPELLYIYAHSHYSLRQIYSLRLRGATWENLSNWCGVPLFRDRSGPPYGNAYGHYKHATERYRERSERWDDERDGPRGKPENGGRGRGRGR
jgi:hypothetical protein